MRRGSIDGDGTVLQIYRFYHLTDANQVLHCNRSSCYALFQHVLKMDTRTISDNEYILNLSNVHIINIRTCVHFKSSTKLFVELYLYFPRLRNQLHCLFYLVEIFGNSKKSKLARSCSSSMQLCSVHLQYSNMIKQVLNFFEIHFIKHKIMVQSSHIHNTFNILICG